MNKKEEGFLPLSDALEEAKKQGINLSRPTIRKYAKEMGFGYQVGHKWFIDMTLFRRFLNGQNQNI